MPMLMTLIRLRSALRERQEFTVFRELLRMVPGLEARLMESSAEETIAIGELVMKFATSVL